MPQVLPAYLPTGALNADAIAQAAKLLRDGGLVGVPTETVYGLAANALDATAVRRIFAAKGRPSFNPLIVHVLDAAAARELAAQWPEQARRLAEAFWPGPLSLVVPKKSHVPVEVTGGLDSVALRSPAHPVARALLAAAGVPFAAPSANRSNAISPTQVDHVVASLGERVDLVLDGGPCSVGIESTVVDVGGARPVILRPGGIAGSAIEALCGGLGHADVPADGAQRSSPGLLSRHYAPDAITLLVATTAFEAVFDGLPADARIGAIVRELPRPSDVRIVGWEKLGGDAESFARNLYAALHRLNSAAVTHVLLEAPPRDPAWEAVADRLRRAAGSPRDVLE